MPTSIFSAVAFRGTQQPRMHEMVVQHHIGLREALQAANGDELGVSGSGADQVDDGFSHDACDSTATCVRSVPGPAGPLSRMSAAPWARSSFAARTPSARASRRGPWTTVRIIAAAIERDDGGDEFELVVAQRRGQRADGRLAPAAERIHDGPFGVEGFGGDPVRDRLRPPASRRRSPVRISIAIIPWPGAGTQALSGSVNEIRESKPSRRRPAAASTSASCAPSSSLRSRVSRLPRIAANFALGNIRVSSATRRTLPVPIDGDWPRRGDQLLETGCVAPPSMLAARPRPADPLARALRRSPAPREAGPACPCCCEPPGRLRREEARPRSPSRTTVFRRPRRAAVPAAGPRRS